jgi:hypothetical protein
MSQNHNADGQLRIHLVVPDPEGPLVTGPGGTPFRLGEGGHFRVACEPGRKTFDASNRGTSEPWAVRCEKCVQTEAFKRVRRPKPGLQAPEKSVAVDNGCC